MSSSKLGSSECERCEDLMNNIREQIGAFKILSSLKSQLSSKILIESLEKVVGVVDGPDAVAPYTQKESDSSEVNSDDSQITTEEDEEDDQESRGTCKEPPPEKRIIQTPLPPPPPPPPQPPRRKKQPKYRPIGVDESPPRIPKRLPLKRPRNSNGNSTLNSKKPRLSKPTIKITTTTAPKKLGRPRKLLTDTTQPPPPPVLISSSNGTSIQGNEKTEAVDKVKVVAGNTIFDDHITSKIRMVFESDGQSAEKTIYECTLCDDPFGEEMEAAEHIQTVHFLGRTEFDEEYV